jgi:hypothetical protein
MSNLLEHARIGGKGRRGGGGEERERERDYGG